MQGIIPGPELFSEDKFWVYCIMGGLFIINIFMFLQGALFNRLFANVARIPFSVLVPCIVIFCVIGGFPSPTTASMCLCFLASACWATL